MVIERERYLDDSRTSLLSLALASRSVQTHSLLTALEPEDRAAVADILAGALDAIAVILRARWPEKNG